jgi:terminase small subunit-like protein
MSDKTTTVTDEAKPDPPAMGRPRKFNAKIAERICDRIAEGDTLLRICTDQGFPTRRTVQRWLRSKPEFAYQYAVARACALDDKCDKILEIIDGKCPTGSENDERVRLARDIARCEQHRRHLAMVWPSRYGEHGAGGMAELLPLLEAQRNGENAKDVTAERPVIMEQDPLYTSYVAWGRGLAEAEEEG